MTTMDSHVTLETAQAEREIIACGIRRPQIWERLRHVRPEWFAHWSDQVLWRAVQVSYEENNCFEVAVVNRWFREYCRDDAAGLLDRLAGIADEYLHAEFVDYYLATLERSGERLATQRWADHVSEMCSSGRSMVEIRQTVSAPPIGKEGAA